jgi:hypothetical protein
MAMRADRVEEILRLIEVGLDEPDLDGTELAGHFHLSRFHLDRLAAASVGEPPGAFPPQSFPYGGMLAHVLTFPAVRRTLGAGDPMRFAAE